MKTGYIKHKGFSLAEVLIATGILALGLVMIAMAFPVGVKLASIATERPVGVVAANEAFAKIRLYSVDNLNPNPAKHRIALDCSRLSVNFCMDLPTLQNTTGLANCFLETLELDNPVNPGITIDNSFERFYPSLVPQPAERRYYWSPLLRRADPSTNEVQTTVFVCRMLGMSAKYYDMDHVLASPLPNNDNPWPVPVKVMVNYPAFGKTITVQGNTQFDAAGQTLTACRFFTDGCMIVEDRTGYIYKVVETQDLSSPKDGVRETLILNKDFPNNGVTTGFPPSGNVDVWVVPPAIGGNRNPCIDVVQTTLILP
jgi:prepilin-type N-terminal cleavage/methylation domain-containing protein